jgi:two-component system NtrC family sensor kinase
MRLNHSTKHIMTKVITLFLFSLGSSIAFAQDFNKDSLKHELGSAKIDTVKVMLFSELSKAYVFYKPDSAFYYAEEGLEMAREINHQNGEATNMFWLAVYFRLTGSPATAMQLATKALSIFEARHNTKEAILCNQMIAWTAMDNQDYNRALDFLFRSVKLAEQNSNYRLYYSYGTIAQIYLEFNKIDSALIYAEKAYMVLDEKRGFPMRVLAEVHERLNQDSLAFKFYHKAISQNSIDDRIGQSEIYSGIAKLFYKIGQLDSSAYYATKAYAISVDNGFLYNIIHVSKLLTLVYETKHMSDSTLKYMKVTIDMNDSLFSQTKIRQFQSQVFNEQLQQRERESELIRYQTKIRTYIFIVLLGTFMLVVIVSSAVRSLKIHPISTHPIRKNGFIGELTAGIAHEIQNPLNFVNNFSEVSNELIDEMNGELEKGEVNEAKRTIAKDVKENLEKINHHGKRAADIVKGMLQHSRASSGQKESTDINTLCDEYLRLSYHGLRAKDKSFNAKFETDFDSISSKTKCSTTGYWKSCFESN